MRGIIKELSLSLSTKGPMRGILTELSSSLCTEGSMRGIITELSSSMSTAGPHKHKRYYHRAVFQSDINTTAHFIAATHYNWAVNVCNIQHANEINGNGLAA